MANLIAKGKQDGIKVLRSAYVSKQDEKYIEELTSNDISAEELQGSDSVCKVINVDGKKISLDANLLTGDAKYVIVMGDNSTITINGNISINSGEKTK